MTPQARRERAEQAAFALIWDCEHVGYRTDLGSWDAAYDKRGACKDCITDALLTFAEQEAEQEVARERELVDPALETAQRVLTTCRKLFGGAGLGGPAALEADCDFALRKIAAALLQGAREGANGL